MTVFGSSLAKGTVGLGLAADAYDVALGGPETDAVEAVELDTDTGDAKAALDVAADGLLAGAAEPEIASNTAHSREFANRCMLVKLWKTVS